VIKQSGGKVIYDLYAVSNHFGSLGGGHYTAFAKNPIYKNWFEFDDSRVRKISSGEV
jgi:ubiquitin C-terminal hydrolase